MDKMLDTDSTQASLLFHSLSHCSSTSSSERIFFEAFRFLELFLTDVVALGFPFSRASRRFLKFLHFPNRSWMFGPDHCCSRLRVYLPRHWNFQLNFQPSSIDSLNQLELVRMDIILSSLFLMKPVSV